RRVGNITGIMNVTRGTIVSVYDLPLEASLPLVVLVGVVVYCLGIAAVFLVIYAKYPHRLKQSAAPAVLSSMVSFMDCSGILQCLPCTDCSLRKALRACCPRTDALRRMVSCDCVKQHMHGQPPAADLLV
ncbi:hypothetical protein V3C99_000656, partial [Haemonchus contortus]